MGALPLLSRRWQRIKPAKLLPQDTPGTITLCPEIPEDMWHVFNLIAVGDHIRASTVRKVPSGRQPTPGPVLAVA